MNNRKKLITAALVFAFGPMLCACIYIASDWLLSGEVEFLKTPRTIFKTELAQLSDGASSDFKSVPATNGYPTQTLTTELSDLAQALEESGIPSDEQQELLSQYQDARAQLAFIRLRVSDWRDAGNTGRVRFEPLPVIPARIPGEFAAYFNGCVQFYLGETNRARQFWHGVLGSPESNRRHRSTWAAFMLGKVDVDTDPGAAIRSFQQVRELAKAGFADSLGLASASYGWEARAELNLGDPAAAIELYLKQQDTGELDSDSLRLAAQAALKLPPDELVNVANNELARAVVSSYLLSLSWNNNNWYRENQKEYWIKWLNAATAADTPDYEAAEQFGWISYQCGQFETAEQWLPFTNPNSPGALWLAAKLLLRNGDINGAAEKLARATELAPISDDAAEYPANGLFSRLQVNDQFDRDSLHQRIGHAGFKDFGRDRIHGDHGVIQFQRRDYVEALNALLIAYYWKEAAYVADRILTLDELQSYVDRRWPNSEKIDASTEISVLQSREESNRARVRHLLARRLSRNGREAEARPYYPEEWLPLFDRRLTCIRDAERPGTDPETKAALLMEAARITRAHGLGLLGSAVGPDWEITEGRFTYYGPSFELRENLPESDHLRPLAEEANRYLGSAPTPDFKRHYRFAAAELAWKAAELMPDQSDETAAMLCEAGKWVMFLNPEYADRFYKALVIRCGYTELGTAADRKRWFPSMNAEGRLSEPMPPPVKTTHSGPWEGDANR